MASSTALSSLLALLLLPLLSRAATFTVTNQCQYTVWAAALPGGGQQLNTGQSWTFNVDPSTASGRVWGRTGCNFDGSGHGSCQTGDCGGLLQCTASGAPPATLAEYTLAQRFDTYDISLVDGFNLQMDFTPTSGHDIRCSADINAKCPPDLKVPGGCSSACNVYKTDEYCCTGSGTCGPTNYSRFFKGLCPDAYSYAKDDPSSTFTTANGNNYRVTFCPV